MQFLQKVAKRSKQSELKRKIFVYLFRKLKQKSCETGCISHPFRMGAKQKIQAKKGHPS
jgi:hypothetical protein